MDEALDQIRIAIADLPGKVTDRELSEMIAKISKRVSRRGRKITDKTLLKLATMAIAVLERRGRRRENGKNLRLGL